MQITAKKGDATEFAKRAVKESFDVVVVVGGDGTINEVASALVNSGTAMGIVPVGSGNGLARTLQIPDDIGSACNLISTGRVSAIDVGKANNRYFFLVAGFGFDAIVGKRFDESPQRGPLPYFYLSAKEYLTYRPQKMKVQFNDVVHEINPFVLAVANGQQYGNNALIAPEAKLDDGLLDVCIVHQLSFLRLFDAIPKLFNGTIENYASAELHKTQSLLVERQVADYMNIDGEPVWEEAVVKISLIPKSLRIVTPPNSHGLS